VVDATGGNSGTNPTGVSTHWTRTGGAIYSSAILHFRLAIAGA
jgi:hypothetical protein